MNAISNEKLIFDCFICNILDNTIYTFVRNLFYVSIIFSNVDFILYRIHILYMTIIYIFCYVVLEKYIVDLDLQIFSKYWCAVVRYEIKLLLLTI